MGLGTVLQTLDFLTQTTERIHHGMVQSEDLVHAALVSVKYVARHALLCMKSWKIFQSKKGMLTISVPEIRQLCSKNAPFRCLESGTTSLNAGRYTWHAIVKRTLLTLVCWSSFGRADSKALILRLCKAIWHSMFLVVARRCSKSAFIPRSGLDGGGDPVGLTMPKPAFDLPGLREGVEEPDMECKPLDGRRDGDVWAFFESRSLLLLLRLALVCGLVEIKGPSLCTENTRIESSILRVITHVLGPHAWVMPTLTKSSTGHSSPDMLNRSLRPREEGRCFVVLNCIWLLFRPFLRQSRALTLTDRETLSARMRSELLFCSILPTNLQREELWNLRKPKTNCKFILSPYPEKQIIAGPCDGYVFIRLKMWNAL